MTSKISPPTRQILGLDLIRFFSAALVLVYHLTLVFWTTDNPASRIMPFPSFVSDAWPFTWFGFVAVQVFFVISGFVIAYSAERSNSSKFFRDRVIRLAPGLWVCASISLAIYLAFGVADVGTSAYLFLREIIFHPFKPWLDVVVWTLPIEIAFYTIVFALLYFRRFDLVTALAAVIACASLAFHLLNLGICSSDELDGTCMAIERYRRLAQLSLLDHGAFFAVGIFLWLWLVKQCPLSSLWWAAPAFVASILQIADIAEYEERQINARGYALNFYTAVPILVWSASVLAIAVSVRFNNVIFGLVGDRCARVVRLIGLATYPLYLLHWTSIGAFAWALSRAGLGSGPAIWGSAFCVVALSFIVAGIIEPKVQAATRWALDKAGPRDANNIGRQRPPPADSRDRH